MVGTVAPDGGVPVRTLRVALVQGGGQRGLSKQDIPPSTVFAAQVAATFVVANAHPSPGLVLWPEDVVALDRPLAGSPQAALLSRLARQLHATLLVGVTEPASATSFRNEVVAWGPSGHIVGVFEKVHRVPFGEYVPFRSLFSHFADLSGVPVDAIPGHGTGLMRTPAGPLGLLVSFEIFYAGRSHAVGAGRRPAADRSHQHLLLQHVAGADAGDGRGHRAGRRDRARPRPGRADRVQRGGDPAGRRRAAQRPRPAPGALRRALRCAAASRPTTTGATSRCWCSPAWPSWPGGPASCTRYS